MAKRLLQSAILKYFDNHTEGTAEQIADWIRKSLNKNTHESPKSVANILKKKLDTFRIKEYTRIEFGTRKRIAIWELKL